MAGDDQDCVQTGGAEPIILVSGFGPFAGHDLNPSQQIAAAMDGQMFQGYRFHACLLETSWHRAWPQLRATAERCRPDALFMLGVSFDPFFRIEAVARNCFVPEADIDGILRPLEGPGPLVPEGPSSYVSTLPLDRLAMRFSRDGESGRAKRTTGFDIAISTDGGFFICNQVFYLASHFLAGAIPRIGFIHVPPAQGWHDGFPAAKVVESGIRLLAGIAGLLSASAAAAT